MRKSNFYALIASIVSTVILFLLLIYVVIPITMPEQLDDEGVEVSFGEVPDAGGMLESAATPSQSSSETPKDVPPIVSRPVSVPKVVKSQMMTQDDNSLAMILEQKRKEREAREAIEQQRQAEARALAEKRRKEQEAIDRANALMGGMGSGGSSKGSGTSSGSGVQGNPAGSGTSGGNSWALSGRSLTGRLVSPSYENDVEGKVTVNIRVNENGDVISASVGSPTTISDQGTRNAALQAARNTHFSGGNSVVSGVITYNFKLR